MSQDSNKSMTNKISQHVNNNFQNEHSINHGRGRGYLLNKLKQRQSLDSSKSLPLTCVLSKDVESNVINFDEIPSCSTYIPPEPDTNDEFIYKTSTNSGINLKNINNIDVKDCGKNVPLPITSVLPKDMKSNFIHFDGPPSRSTYIPTEPDENDESIYNTGINSGINFKTFNEIEVNVSGKNVPEKILEFDNNIPEAVMQNINKCNYMTPTPIQKYTIPFILSGKDLMAAAHTGSGKTVAYVLPIIIKLLKEPCPLVKSSNHSEPQVIILAPTRELAVQIHIVIKKLSRGTGILSLVCYGGTSVSHQKKRILEGCHILVATPGRLIEFIENDFIKFSSVRIFVLDEVDRLLDELKFDVDTILEHYSMPSIENRQTIMLSATLPDPIQHLASCYLNKNYLFLVVGIVNSASKDIKQHFVQVNKYKKRLHLVNLLQREDPKGTIVFVGKRWIADFLAAYLSEKHIPSTSLHGDRLQDQREKALSDFGTGKMSVLVATAVASRGLDIKCVNHVIIYDMPKTIEEYIQQIGRTGRLGNEGKATSLLEVERDYHLIEPIIKILSSAHQEIPCWLVELGKKVKETNSYDFVQLDSSDIRLKSNAVDEEEDW